MFNKLELRSYLLIREIKGVGDRFLSRLATFSVSFEEVYNRRLEEGFLQSIGLDVREATLLKGAITSERIKLVDEELEFIEKYSINVLIKGEKGYPYLLSEAEDSPYILFAKGEKLDFDSYKSIAIVGTRKYTDYGKKHTCLIVQEFVQEIPNALVISGLAKGIDSIAHKAALECGIKTVACLAHGLDKIYPPENRTLALEIVSNGCLITRYTRYDTFLSSNFLQRNRIIAGVSDAVLIAESPVKGGAMSTARAAGDYNRTLFAFPGDLGRETSVGTNLLINDQRAVLCSNFRDISFFMGWSDGKRATKEKVPSLDIATEDVKSSFKTTQKGNVKKSKEILLNKESVIDDLKDLTDIGKRIITMIRSFGEGDEEEKGFLSSGIGFDEIAYRLSIPSADLASELFNLELEDYLESKPGGVYKLKKV